MKTSNFDDLINELRELDSSADQSNSVADKAEAKAATSTQRDSKTRSTLTLTFLLGFFGMLLFSCLFVIWYNHCAVEWVLKLQAKNVPNSIDYIKPLELDKVLSIMIGALGTSLGFIIGYYFKEKEK